MHCDSLAARVSFTCALTALSAPALMAAPQSHLELVVVAPVGGSSLAISRVTDVNDVGLVVGRREVNNVLVPFEWTVAGGFRTPTHLPPGMAFRRVNNAGDSVSWATESFVRADGTHVPIPDPLGGLSNGGTDLNDALQVVGQGVSTGTTSGLFTWHPQGPSTTLPIPAGSAVRRINAHGLAVGYRLLNGTNERAFVVDVNTLAWTDLHGMLGGQGSSEAFDVNDHGVVVGFGPDGTSLSAWVWSPGTGFTFLPAFDNGETMYVMPRAIDNQGRVVGTAMNGAGDYRAFLWDPVAGMLDLNTVVTGGTFTLIEALDISETGVIIGRGFHGTVWGPERGFIAYPPTVGTNFCASNPNSTGESGALVLQSLDWIGRRVQLFAADLPRNAFAYTICSRTPGSIANPGGSAGNLCLGGQIGRRVGGAILSTGETGLFLEDVDLDSLPQPQGAVAAQVGETWHFQLWHRDSVQGVATSNFTNGVRRQFP